MGTFFNRSTLKACILFLPHALPDTLFRSGSQMRDKFHTVTQVRLIGNPFSLVASLVPFQLSLLSGSSSLTGKVNPTSCVGFITPTSLHLQLRGKDCSCWSPSGLLSRVNCSEPRRKNGRGKQRSHSRGHPQFASLSLVRVHYLPGLFLCIEDVIFELKAIETRS